MRASPAAKVAAVATVVIAGVYIIGVIVLNLVVARHMTDQNDARLAGRITAAQHDPAALSQRVVRGGPAPGPRIEDIDADTAPVFLWSADAPGADHRAQPGGSRAALGAADRAPAPRRARGHAPASPRWARSG